MSLDNINAENRNGTVNDGPRNRINNLRNIARQRCCSFCREPGHTNNWCNDQRLRDFENLCISKKNEIENTDNPSDCFQDWIINYCIENQVIVKAFAIRKCGSTSRSTINTCIVNIMEYFYGEFYDLPDLINSETRDDFIPFAPLSDNYNTNDELSAGPLYVFGPHQISYINVLQIINMITPFPTDTNSIGRKFKINTKVLPEQDETTICECNICYESFNITDFVKLNCGHEFCKECTKKSLNSCLLTQNPGCAYCREKIVNFSYKKESVKTEFLDMLF
jgi:hypothetical protein